MAFEEKKEKLRPTYNPSRPPWIGLWTGREYKGRANWWGELGQVYEDHKKGRFQIVHARYREEDPDWWDPKVEDGTSLAGPFGLDSRKYPNLTNKGDTPGNLKDFQEKVYKGSHQYKSIVEKYDISKEHPGFKVAPHLDSLMQKNKNRLGANGLFSNSWYFYGPRFFDKPLDEGTLEKGLACAKYAAILMLPFTMCEIRAFNSVPVLKLVPRTFMKRYFQLCPLPVAIAFTWGTALSAAAAVRHKDDVRNHLFSSAAVGVTLSAIKNNIAMGITATIVTLVLGTVWQYSRLSEAGLMHMTPNQQSGGIWGGPFAWKFFTFGTAKVPTTQY